MDLQKLWELQTIRKEKERVESELKNSPFGEELEQLKTQIEDAEEKLKELKEKKEAADKKAKKSYLEEMELEEKEKKLNEMLYGGNISNPKELAGIQEKLASLDKEKGRTTEEYLHTSIETEELENQIEELNEKLDKYRLEYGTKLANYESFREECEEKIKFLTEKSAEIEGEVDPQSLKKYESFYSRFGTTAIAKIVGEMCSGCQLMLPMSIIDKVKKGNVLVKCENCGRILFNGR